MATLDFELVRHALQVAQSHGFAEVEIGLDGSSFRAGLDPKQRKKPAPSAAQAEAPAAEAGNGVKAVRSPLVGFYRVGPQPLEAGKQIAESDIVAVVNALGIANEVEAKVAGEIVEVLVEDGQAVQFGQVLATVKP